MKMQRMQYYLAALLLWFALTALCATPTFFLDGVLGFRGGAIGGGPIRLWVCNTLLFPMLPHGLAQAGVAFYSRADELGKWLLASVTLIPYVLAFIPLLLLVAPPIGRLRALYRHSLNS